MRRKSYSAHGTNGAHYHIHNFSFSNTGIRAHTNSFASFYSGKPAGHWTHIFYIKLWAFAFTMGQWTDGQMDHHYRWTCKWHSTVFLDEWRFCLEYHNGRIRVWRQDGRCSPSSVILFTLILQPVLWCRVVLDAIHAPCWYGWTISLLQTAVSLSFCNLFCPWYSGLICVAIQQDNARPHVARYVQAFWLSPHLQNLLFIVYVSSRLRDLTLALKAAPASTPDALAFLLFAMNLHLNLLKWIIKFILFYFICVNIFVLIVYFSAYLYNLFSAIFL